MRKTFLNQLGVACVVLFYLQACSVRPDVTHETSINTTATLTENWQANGRVAIITPDDKDSTYFTWRNTADTIELTFTTLVGTTIARITQTPEQATMVVDDETFIADTAEELISRVIGWNIPVKAVQRWIIGQAIVSDVKTNFDNGLLKTVAPQEYGLRDWHIHYTKYETMTTGVDQQQIPLPTRINIDNNATKHRIIIRVDNWRVDTASANR